MSKWRRLNNLFRRKRLAADIEAELQAHLAMAAEDKVGAGMNESDARRVALMRFGNPVAIQERTARADAVLALE
jgi:hypothetical protein